MTAHAPCCEQHVDPDGPDPGSCDGGQEPCCDTCPQHAPSGRRSWDIGDPEPEGVTRVYDHTHPADIDEEPALWGRTAGGDWKGYKNGGKIYLDWPELVRRWGPVEETP